ncbi:MAG: c-type cytochrome [Steroidobacterales bacterium]
MKSTKMTALSVFAAAAVAMLSTAALAQDTPAAVEVTPAAAQEAEFTATTRCGLCHGPQGHSISPIYPALGGQKGWYIDEQLHLFKAQTRRDPYARGYMWGMAAQLDDLQIAALADYYSKQTPFVSAPAPFSGSANAALVAKGQSVYNDGVPANGVAPCAACHQADASGSDQFPRLAGQHASYLLKQLRAFHSGSREQVVMNGIVGPLQESDMKAVAAYLESIH